MCQKSFGIATCQTDHIVLTATPVSGRNKNCFWADNFLRALISLVDIPDGNADTICSYSDLDNNILIISQVTLKKYYLIVFGGS